VKSAHDQDRLVISSGKQARAFLAWDSLRAKYINFSQLRLGGVWGKATV